MKRQIIEMVVTEPEHRGDQVGSARAIAPSIFGDERANDPECSFEVPQRIADVQVYAGVVLVGNANIEANTGAEVEPENLSIVSTPASQKADRPSQPGNAWDDSWMVPANAVISRYNG